MSPGWVRTRRVVGLAGVLAVAVALLWAGPVWGAEVVNPDGVAVIIGNRDYRHASDVKYAHRDAEAFKRYVVEVLGFDPERILYKADASLTDMVDLLGNLEEVDEAEVSWLLEEAENPSEADVVVFYSGHGVPGLGDKRGYLMPVDAKPDKVKTQAYPLDLLLKNVGKLGAGSVAVYVDACFSGNSETGMLFEDASPVNVQVRLPRGEGSDRVTLLTAATGDQLASWDTKRKQGLFTHHLLAGLRGGADLDRNGQVTAGEAKAYLDEHMTSAARRLKPRRRQTATLRGAKDRVLSAARFSTQSPEEAEGLRVALARAEEEKAALEQKLETVQKETAALLKENATLERERDEAVQARLKREAEPPAAVEAALGLDREARLLIQLALASLEFDPGPVDGAFGPRTRGAIRSWQEAKGYEATGPLTKDQAETLKAVGRAARARGDRERAAKAEQERRRAAAAKAAAEAERLALEAMRPGREFRDCEGCPEMVVVPAGSYRMGSPAGEVGRYGYEGPRHEVRIGRPLAVGKYEVTFGEWGACVADGGCGGHRPSDAGWGRGRRPVINVSWEDAQAYVRWLSGKTGQGYRLLSEAEWEYVARAGTSTAYWWGDEVGRSKATCDGCGSRWDNDGTAPVGWFAANAFGLYDVHGNVWEWVEDCWHDNYWGAPTDGSAWATEGGCRRVLRGGSWILKPRNLRSAIRRRSAAGIRNLNFGFRVARTLTP